MSLHVALIEYNNISGKTLQQSIESEMSGNLEKLLVAVGKLYIKMLCSVWDVLILKYHTVQKRTWTKCLTD